MPRPGWVAASALGNSVKNAKLRGMSGGDMHNKATTAAARPSRSLWRRTQNRNSSTPSAAAARLISRLIRWRSTIDGVIRERRMNS
jgi:hypothetical protein